MKKFTATAIFITVLVLFLAPWAEASRTHVVTEGDNLYDISRHYGVTVKQIMRANKMRTNRLKIDAVLTIPDSKTASSAKQSPKAAPVASAAPSQAERKLASEITADAGPSQAERELARDLTGAGAPSRAERNLADEIAAQASEQAEIEEEADSGAAAADETVVENITYTVKKGDTLASIARKNGITVTELKRLNHAKRLALRPRKTIVIGTQTVRREESRAARAETLNDQIKVMVASPEIKTMGVTNRVLLLANKMLDIPYRFGGNTFMGIDCSAFVRTVFGLLNLNLPRTAREQFKVGEKVAKDDLLPGDLVFFHTYAKFPSHVGIYLGDNLFIHASSVARKITIDNITRNYYSKHYIGARRIVDDSLDADSDDDVSAPKADRSGVPEPKM